MSGSVTRDVTIRMQLDVDGLKVPSIDTTEYRKSIDSAAAYARQQLGSLPSSQSRQAVDVRAAEVDRGIQRLSKKDMAIAKAAEEEKAAMRERERIDRETASRRMKDVEDLRKAKEKAYKEEQDWIRKNTAASSANAVGTTPSGLSGVAPEATKKDAAKKGVSKGGTSAPTTITQYNNEANAGAFSQVGQATKMAGEGLFHLIRGIALYNASSEEELAATIKKIAFYQGLFDVVKGGIDITEGLYRATKALTGAQAAGSAVQLAKDALSPRGAKAAVAAASAASTTGLFNTAVVMRNTGAVAYQGQIYTGAAAAVTKFGMAARAVGAVLMGPVGIALAAGSAAIYLFWRNSTAAAEKQRESWQKFAESFARNMAGVTENAMRAERAQLALNATVKAFARYEVDTNTLRSQQEVVGGGVLRQDNSAIYMTAQERDRDQYRNTQDLYKRRMKQFSGYQSQQESLFEEEARQTLYASARDSNLNEYGRVKETQRIDKLSGAQVRKEVFSQMPMSESDLSRMEQDGMNRVRKAEKAYDLNPKDEQLRDNLITVQKTVTDELNKQKELQRAQLSNLRRQVSDERERMNIQKEYLDSLRQGVQAERARLDSLRLQRKEEQNRQLSATQKFGQMTPWEQQEIKQLSSQVQSGGLESLTREQRDRLRQSGFADSLFSHYDNAQGQAAGASQVFSQLGTFNTALGQEQEGQNVGETTQQFIERQAAESQALLGKTLQDMEQVIKEQEESRNKILEKLGEVGKMEKVANAFDKFIDRLMGSMGQITKKIETIEEDIKYGFMSRR